MLRGRGSDLDSNCGPQEPNLPVRSCRRSCWTLDGGSHKKLSDILPAGFCRMRRRRISAPFGVNLQHVGLTAASANHRRQKKTENMSVSNQNKSSASLMSSCSHQDPQLLWLLSGMSGCKSPHFCRNSSSLWPLQVNAGSKAPPCDCNNLHRTCRGQCSTSFPPFVISVGGVFFLCVCHSQ